MALFRRLPLFLLAALPLIAWPGISQPFSTPKLWSLVAIVITLAPIAWLARRQHRAGEDEDPSRGAAAATSAAGASGSAARRQGVGHTERGLAREEAVGSGLPPMPRWMLGLVALWLASWSWSSVLGDVVSLDAVVLAFAAALFAVILTALSPQPEQIAIAMVVGATGVAVVAIGQWVGVDVFALAGWVAPFGNTSARLRVYGTLGNPNFVAALVVATMPITLGVALWTRFKGRAGLRTCLFVALGLQALALIATGSRGGALGLLVAALVWGADTSSRWEGAGRGWRRAGALIAMAGCGVALLAIAVSTARPLSDTAAGRAYIVRVSWPHAFEAPWAGRGPGAFELLYPAWELHARHAGDADGARFGGPQQHAHNDYLEALIERGLLGPVTILGILATCFWNGWRHTGAARDAPLVTGTFAMLAALAVMACVDFPLARPTETTWWWCGVVIIALTERRG